MCILSLARIWRAGLNAPGDDAVLDAACTLEVQTPALALCRRVVPLLEAQAEERRASSFAGYLGASAGVVEQV